MGKLKLDLDALNVETFDTQPEERDGGTVLGNANVSGQVTCVSCYGTCATCVSCQGTCNLSCIVRTCAGVTCGVTCVGNTCFFCTEAATCPATCAQTCQYTCKQTCAVTCKWTCEYTCNLHVCPF